jgi:hypothetical protein
MPGGSIQASKAIHKPAQDVTASHGASRRAEATLVIVGIIVVIGIGGEANSDKGTPMKPVMKPTEATTVERKTVEATAVEAAAVETTKATVETATAAVETAAAAVTTATAMTAATAVS